MIEQTEKVVTEKVVTLDSLLSQIEDITRQMDEIVTDINNSLKGLL